MCSDLCVSKLLLFCPWAFFPIYYEYKFGKSEKNNKKYREREHLNFMFFEEIFIWILGLVATCKNYCLEFGRWEQLGVLNYDKWYSFWLS